MVQIVCLQKGKGSAPLYCLPTASGSSSAYLDVAAALAPDHAVYGVELSERTKTGALRVYASLREMAEAVAAAVLAHSRNDPIRLMGYSFAGHLAVQLAQHLEQCGHRVSLVVLIDTMPSWPSFTRTFRACHVARYAGPWLLNNSIGSLLGRLARWRHRAVFPGLQRQYMFERDEWFLNMTRERQEFLLSNLSLSYSYAFEGSCRGRLLLLRPTGETYRSPLRTGQLRDFGWQRVTGADVRVEYISGNHASCLHGANAIRLAQKLRLAFGDRGLAPRRAPEEPSGVPLGEEVDPGLLAQL